MSSASVDRLMHDLKVIAAQREGDRLYIAEGRLRILHPSVVGSLWRWTRGDSREKSLAAVQSCFMDALALAEHRVARSAAAPPGPTQEGARRTTRHLVAEVDKACAGLRQMRATYIDDDSARATLDVLRERVAGRLATLRALSGEPEAPRQAHACLFDDGLSNLVIYAIDDGDGFASASTSPS